MGHHHHHHHASRGKALGISILLNILITVLQVIGGILSGSLALLSDALHNFSDVLALVISYIADKMTHIKSSETKSFGYKRAEIIAAMLNAMTLLGIGAFLIVEAIDKIQNPNIIDSFWIIILALASILLNGLSVLLLKKDSKDSVNIKSAYLHLFTDMLTSIGVLAGGIAISYFQVYWIDGIITIVIATYLIYSSFSLLMETLKILMQFAPDSIDIYEIEKAILTMKEVENIHHVHIWKLNDNDIHFESHIDFIDDLKLSEVTTVSSKIENLLKNKFKISHITLQSEFGKNDHKDLISEAMSH